MAEQRSYLTGLARLHTLESQDERRGVWRQAMATLGAAVLDQRSAPLEGLSPHAVQASVRLALAEGMLEELDFLSESAAAAALYELGAVLPSGPEKRAVGRRVLTDLRKGNARTFVVLASQLARGSSRALEGDDIRARVALCLDLPFGVGATVDSLALTLLASPERAREWVVEPSIGSLPSRRLAARLLERAAREAVRRHDEGDPSGVLIFQTPSVSEAWRRLLRDREPFVWRYVASARGLLADVIPQFASEIYSERDPELTPMEWRRCATSTAAAIAHDPQEALEAATSLLEGPVLKSDPGIAAAMVRGLARAAEVELPVVNELLERLVRIGDFEVMEALLELRREQIGDNIGQRACTAALERLDAMLKSADVSDWGQKAIIQGLRRDLADELEGRKEAFTHRVDEALLAFLNQGPDAALRSTEPLLRAMSATIQELENADHTTEEGVIQAHDALSRLDEALLQRSTCGWLLQLSSEQGGRSETALKQMDALLARATQWLIERERQPLGEEEVEHFLYRVRRMRFVLHLLDAEGEYVQQTGGVNKRVMQTTMVLLSRVRNDAETPLMRVTAAAAARGCEALCRQESVEIGDVLFLVARHAIRKKALQTFAEASTDPSIRGMLYAYAGLAEYLRGDVSGGVSSRRSIDGLRAMATSLPTGATPRVDALRTALLGIARALEQLAQAGSLAEVSDSDGILGRLEFAVDELAWLVRGSKLRLGVTVDDDGKSESSAAIRMVDFAVDDARGDDPSELLDSIELARTALRGEVPPLIAEVVAKIMLRLTRLPKEQTQAVEASMPPVTEKLARLPQWFPPSRSLGPFYVLRPLGGGAVGSVFVARRTEDKHDAFAPLFALKVPEYDGSAARELSEAEFHELFREEAGALLSLPQHPNLARLATFDATAKPKPILVMELVQGHTLERMIARHEMSCVAVATILDGVAAGLEIMHLAGIGHLDIKPSNIILRESDDDTLQPVLVDFGLAGRKVRPGCATGEYGAPEIWGAFGADHVSSPTKADVYAFGCVAFEMLTGSTLFRAPNEVAQITAHISHDGEPEGVAMLRKIKDGDKIADVLVKMLRHKPDDRITIEQARKELSQVLKTFAKRQWPLLQLDSQAVA